MLDFYLIAVLTAANFTLWLKTQKLPFERELLLPVNLKEPIPMMQICKQKITLLVRKH